MGTDTSSSTATIGKVLQDARSARGLTIEAAAAASKVSLSFVRLMEEEQFHLLPDPLYIVRFLTEYSAFLGLDPKQVDTQFRRQVRSPRPSAPSQAMAARGQRLNLRRLLVYLLPVVAAVPLIFIVLSLFSGVPPELPPDRQARSPQPQEAAMQLPPGGGVASLRPQESPLVAAKPKASNLAQPVTAPGAGESRPQPFRYALKAEAKETTWLVVSADGADHQQAVLHPGEAAQWSANKRFVVTIGNAAGIALSLNGKPVILRGGRGQVIRDLTLPDDGERESTR